MLISVYSMVLAFSGNPKATLKKAWVFKVIGVLAYIYVMAEGMYKGYREYERVMDGQVYQFKFNDDQWKEINNIGYVFTRDYVRVWGLQTFQVMLLFIQCFMSSVQNRYLYITEVDSKSPQPQCN